MRTQPEVAACEDRLKCAIEGIDKDKILIRFTHIDPADLTREFSLVVDVSSRAYKGTSSPPQSFPFSAHEWRLTNVGPVPTTTPFLPNLPILLDELNESRDIYVFIRRVREAFQDLAVQGR